MFTFFRRLRARLKYRHFERDLAQEIDVHRAMKQDELEADGVAPGDARATAARALGNVTYMREEGRSVWISRWLEHTWQDLRYAVRQLRQFPAYSVGATLVLAIGVATTTVVFSGMNAILLRAWPVDESDRLILVKSQPTPDGQFSPTTAAEAQYLRTRATSVSHLATYMRGGAVFNDPRVDVQSNGVSASYFDTLRVRVALGRALTEDDERAGAPAVGLISDHLWRTVFQSDPTVVGRTVRIMNVPLTIVGVVQSGFEDVHRMRIDLWVPHTSQQATSAPPLRAEDEANQQRKLQVHTLEPGEDDLTRPVNIVARLVDGVDAGRAAIELQALSRQFRVANNLLAVDLDVRDTRPINDPGARSNFRQFRLLFPALGLVLVLVCANVGGLILARTSARHREFAVRMAIGAGRGRVARQVFTEVLLLALGAGAIGVLASRVLPHLMGDRMRADHFAPDALVFVAAFLLSVVAALMAASSALFSVRRITVSALIARQHGKDPASARARALLIATQLAVSTAILTGAGLMTRAVVHASAADPGFAVDNVDTFRLIAGGGLPLAQQVALSRQWRTEVAGLGIAGLAFASHPPLSRSYEMAQVRRAGDHGSSRRLVSKRSVSSSYFDVLGIRLIEGRSLSDLPGSGELVVSEKAAQWLWPAESALGKSLVVREGPDDVSYIVAGMVRDVATRALGTTEATIYTGCEACAVMVSRDLAPGVVAQLTGAALLADRSARVERQTVRQNVTEQGSADLQDAGTAAWIIGLSTLALSLIGAFGVLAYTVEERRREIGIRMALGGGGWPVAISVMATANRPALWGMCLGVVAAALVATAMRHAVFGLTPLDPVAYGLVMLVLIPALVVATALPARRATRVNPAITLRHD